MKKIIFSVEKYIGGNSFNGVVQSHDGNVNIATDGKNTDATILNMPSNPSDLEHEVVEIELTSENPIKGNILRSIKNDPEIIWS